MAGLMRMIAITLLALAHPAMAQSLDPTTPPAGWLTPGADSAGAAVPGEGALRLQSALVPAKGRPVAVISGKTVALGERIGGATLLRLSEHEAVLQGSDGVTHLYLTPDVEKRMIEPPKSRQAGKSGHVKDLP